MYFEIIFCIMEADFFRLWLGADIPKNAVTECRVLRLSWRISTTVMVKRGKSLMRLNN